MKVSLLKTEAGLPHEQPDMQLSGKREGAPGRSLQEQRAAHHPLHR